MLLEMVQARSFFATSEFTRGGLESRLGRDKTAGSIQSPDEIVPEQSIGEI
jgi:hypothetical protein